MMTATDRYRNDPIFRTLVDQLEVIIAAGNMTGTEVREAAVMACINYEMRRQLNERTPIIVKDRDQNGVAYIELPRTQPVMDWLAGVEEVALEDWPAYFAARPWDVIAGKAVLRGDPTGPSSR